MEKQEPRRRVSLKTGMLAVIFLCWALPVVLLASFVSVYVVRLNTRQARGDVENSVGNAVTAVVRRLDSAVVASRNASYVTTVKSAWGRYGEDKDASTLYVTSRDYLEDQYKIDEKVLTAFLDYQDESCPLAYMYKRSAADVLTYRYDYRQEIRELAAGLDTRTGFLSRGGHMYLVRNIVDNSYAKFAVLVLELDPAVIFESAENVVWAVGSRMWVDGEAFAIQEGAQPFEQTSLLQEWLFHDALPYDVQGAFSNENYTLSYRFTIDPWTLRSQLAGTYLTFLVILCLLLPLMGAVVWFLHRNVTKPIRCLSESASRIEHGEFGAQTDLSAMTSREFRYLGDSFNAMSGQLRAQFDHIYREELALRDARIMALQSQINPHFLNNTLEIVNWEARMAGDVKVCRMLEALSTILSAAMDRDKRATVHLSEELMYVDAYLYIIRERLGRRLTVERDIDPALLDCQVPRLILQPILENAVDHGIGPTGQGTIAIRAYREGEEMLILAVENDGVTTGKDLERIERLLSNEPPPPGTGHTSLGIRNVNQRLKVLYGSESGLLFNLDKNGRSICKICIKLSQGEQ